jgi:hypothetical protein
MKPTFTQATRAYWSHHALHGTQVEEIYIFDRSDDNPGLSEFAIRWHDFKSVGTKTPSPQLGMFYEAWAWLDLVPDLFRWLASKQGVPVTPEEVVAKLLELGFEDETPEVDPHTGEGPGKREVGQAPAQAK